MQATITYQLTEASQREQMAATDRPVDRFQIQRITIDPVDIGLFNINSAGELTLNMIDAVGDNNLYSAAKIGESTTPLEALERYKTAITRRQQREAEQAAKKAAATAANLASQLETCDRFFADPSLRASSYSSGTTYIDGARVDRDANEYHAACPRWDELVTEIQRREALDSEARRIKEVEAARVRAEREAQEAAHEAEKTQFLTSWIAAHGTDSQKARSAEGLLCREEAVGALADSAFESLAGFVAYTRDSAPRPQCSNEQCDDEYDGCGITYSVKDEVDCLNDQEFARYEGIRAGLPGAKYVLRTRSAMHSCNHTPDCASGEIHTCLVKVRTGPFTLQREYRL